MEQYNIGSVPPPVLTPSGRNRRSKRARIVAAVASLIVSAESLCAFTWQLNEGFESGALSAPWKVDNAHLDGANVTVQSSPKRAGNYAAHIVNDYSDHEDVRNRTEMTVTGGKVLWDNEYWISFSFYLKDWETSQMPEAIHQFHAVPHCRDFENAKSGRNLTSIIVQNGMLMFQTILKPNLGAANGGALANTVWQEPLQQNSWYDCVIHVRPSLSSNGSIEVWMNGDKIYERHGANVDAQDSLGKASEPEHYLKCGVYNWPWGAGLYDVTRREVIYDEVRIGHVEGGYTGGYGGIAVGGTVLLPSVASAPSNMTADWLSPTQVNLTWADHSSNETGFKIERKSGSGATYTQIATVSAGTSTYTDSTATADTTYYYRVRAYNGAAHSPYSPAATTRRENFANGATDFEVLEGSWATTSTHFKSTANGSHPIDASLALLDTPVSGDFLLTVDCKSIQTGSEKDNFNIIFGYQDELNYYCLNAVEEGNGVWGNVRVVVNGVATVLSKLPNIIPGQTYSLAIHRIGSAIIVHQDGVLLKSLIDGTFASGKIGFGTSRILSGTKTAEFSNVSLVQDEVSALQEDFSAGAGNFTVAQGSWALSNGGYEVTGIGANALAAALSLYNAPVTGDFTITADSGIINTGSSWDNLNIVFNYQDINNYYCVNFAEKDNGTWNGIYRVQNGVASALSNISTLLVPGNKYNLKVTKVGNVISVYEDSVLRGTATDATFAGGKIGFGTSRPTSGNKYAWFDNIMISQP